MLPPILLLFPLLSIPPSLSTPIDPLFLNPSMTYNIPPPPAAPLVSLLPLTASSPPTIHCTSWPNWTASSVETDCYKALDIFYERDVKRHKRTLYEWVTIGDRPVGRDAPVWVPRGVVVQSCAIAISTLAHVRGAPLPGEAPHSTYERTDTASYWDVYAVARRVLGGCVSGRGEVGWGAVGEDQSLGVFVWGSGSLMQKANFPERGVVLVDSPLNVTVFGG